MLQAITVMAETAGGSGVEGLVSSMTTGFSTMASDILGAIGSILPVVLPVMGGVLVVAIGIKTAKGVAKK